MKKIRNGSFINLGYFSIIFVIAFGLITFVGCSGGGDDAVAPQPQPGTCVDVSGTWNTTEVDDATGCGEGFTTHDEEYTITQSGCNITIDGGLFGTASGTVNGSQITYTGSFPDEGGTTTGTVNLTISGNSLNGSANWTWSDGTSSCSGTTQISGTRSGVIADPLDPCAGSVPCLTTDWNGVFYEFKEADGSQIIVSSEGNVFAGAGFTDEGWIIGLGGTPTDCYNGTLSEGGLDTDLDGVIDDVFDSVSGNLNICGSTLSITNVVLDGDPNPDIVATYVGVAQVVAAAVYSESENLPEVLYETLDKVRGD
jgi:hypothetical protein